MRSPSVPVIAEPDTGEFTAGESDTGESDTGEFTAGEFTAALRCAPQSVNPPGRRVDWSRAPWPVKVYSGGDRVPLGVGDPLSDSSGDSSGDRLGGLLWLAFGVSRVRFDPAGGLPPTPANPRPAHPRYLCRRPIPSGGGMYPTEVYVLRGGRVHHYDPYRHELVDLRHPAPHAALRDALGLPAGSALPPELLVITNRPAKNYAKYGDFAARLGMVDAGVALGRAVRLGQAAYDRVDLRVDFADADLNALLGLDGAEETALAVLGLGAPADADPAPASGTARPPATLERSTVVTPSPRFDALRTDAYRGTPEAVPFGPKPTPPTSTSSVAPDRDAMLRRTSNGRLFTGRPVGKAVLTAVLAYAADAVGLLRWASDGLLGGGVEVCVAVHNVDGVPRGWYRRDLSGTPGETARELQAALFAETVNLDLAAFTVHVVADTGHEGAGHEGAGHEGAGHDGAGHGGAGHEWAGRGARGYREQQLAIGAAVDAVTLAAAATGLGGHPVLGFDAPRVDRAYGLDGTGRGTHAQVSVGAVRPPATVEVTVTPR
ncbi:nitroreductase family protein [Actinokineospora sp. 24-640]